MQEEFEKKIKERMHTFGIQPAHDVWDGIDAALNRQKHRRFFVGWWILLGLVVLGGAVLLLDKNTITNGKLNQQPTNISDTLNSSHFAEKPKTPGAENKIATQNNNNSSQQTQNLNKPAGNNSTNNTKTAMHGNTMGGKQQHSVLQNKGSFSFKSHQPGIGNEQTGPAAANTNETARFTPLAGAENINGDVAKNTGNPNTSPNQPTLANKDADSAVMPPKQQATAGIFTKPDKTEQANSPKYAKAKTIANPTSKWFLTFSAGTTQTVSPGAFNVVNVASSLTSANSASYANVPAITALSAYKYNIAQPGIGFHISAGGLYERELSSHWNVFGGISLAFLSNTQQTGVEYKGYLPVLSNSNYNLLSSQLILQSYFQPGATSTVVNKAWQIEAPVGAGYVFNPKSKTKFILNGGLSFAWLFSSAWLIPDARYDKLYYSKTVFNNTAVNWQVGPAIELKNQWRFGLQYQQSFTTLAKNYVTPKLYWQNISVYTAIPLGRGKKHK